MNRDFAVLGEQLEAAALRQIRRTASRRRRVTAPLVVGALIATGAGSALAAGVFDLPGPIDLPTTTSYHVGQVVTLPDGRRCVVGLKTADDRTGVVLAQHRCFLLPVPPNKTKTNTP
jgi:hypothetical protein